MLNLDSENTVTLYRAENPNIPARPNGETSHEDLVGQWFSSNLFTAMNYARRATQRSRETGEVIDGARLVMVRVPVDRLESHHVSQHPIAQAMWTEPDNYIIPRDDTYPTAIVDLDPIIAELRGGLGNVHKFNEAHQRIVKHLGNLASD